MSFFKKSILFLMTSILVFSSFNFDITAKAADNQFAKFEEQFEKLQQITDETELNTWIELAEEQVSENKLILSNVEHLSFEDAKAYKLKDEPYVTVGIPVVSENHHEISSVSIYFNEENKELETYTELELKRSDEGYFQIIMTVDGVENFNKITEDKFITVEEYQKQQGEGIGTFGIDWDGFGKCLGIPGVTARWLSYICGATCVITLGTACVVCISGAIGITGGSVLACLGQYWN